MLLIAVGDDSTVNLGSGRRRFEAHLLLECDKRKSQLHDLSKSLAAWRSRHAPQILPSTDPPTKAQAFSSAYARLDRSGTWEWNNWREPKWAGVFSVLRRHPDLFADRKACRELFSPIAELLDIVASAPLRSLIVIERPYSSGPATHREEHEAVAGILSSVSRLVGTAPHQRLHLYFDRDQFLGSRRRVLAVRSSKWPNHAEKEATKNVGGVSYNDVVRRYVSAVLWAYIRCVSIHRLASVAKPHLKSSRLSTVMDRLLGEAVREVGEWYEHAILHPVKTWERTPAAVRKLTWKVKKRTTGQNRLTAMDRSDLCGAIKGAVAQHQALIPHSSSSFEGPNMLETEIAPVMLASDFLVGISAFFLSGRNEFWPIGAPAMALTDCQLFHTVISLRLGRGAYIDRLASRIGVPVKHLVLGSSP